MMKLKHLFWFVALISIGCTNNSNKDQNNLGNSDLDTLTVQVEKNEVRAINETTDTLSIEETSETIVDEQPTKEASFRAYRSDPDLEHPTNVRKTPNGEVILKINRGSDYILHIIACQGRWFKVNKITSADSDLVIPGGAGWMHGSVIAFDTRSSCRGRSGIHLYEKPNENSKLINLEPYPRYGARLKLMAIEGKWVKGEWDNKGNKVIGWIDKECTCGNPYTTCP